MLRKRSFDIDEVVTRLRVAVAAFADAAMFALADAGHRSLFAQLVACIISIRTLDEVSLPAAIRLLDDAPTPRDVARLSLAAIDTRIHPATFHTRKAAQIRAIAERCIAEFGGKLPCDFDVLTSFAGVGPKCASLALGIACNEPYIAVDVHVHRVTNRWGYVRTKRPDETMHALQQKLPRAYWVEINRLLVPFGKHVCTGARPWCTRCPLLEYCHQVGVTDPR